MIVRVDALEAQRLISEGVRTLDVLPASVFAKVHLPGATSLPLEEFQPAQVEALDRAEPLLVYCYDQHCDLSARASARLDDMGFERVHDLIGGRAAWTALGLPTVGDLGDRGRVSEHVSKVPTLSLDSTIADVVALGEQRFPIPVVGANEVLLGAVDPTAAALPPSTPVDDVMAAAPRTIRPEVRGEEAAEQLRADGLDHVFVTAVNGVLLGLLVADELAGSVA
jgi:rhodanese-related sulfurtransferase